MLTTAELIRHGIEHLQVIAPDYNDWKADELEYDPGAHSWTISFIGSLPGADQEPETFWDILNRPRHIVKVVRLNADDGSLLSIRNQAA